MSKSTMQPRTPNVGAGLRTPCVRAGLCPAAGCGQKGPLYVPGYPRDAIWPAAEAARSLRRRPCRRRLRAFQRPPIRPSANERPTPLHPVFALRDGRLHCESVALEEIWRDASAHRSSSTRAARSSRRTAATPTPSRAAVARLLRDEGKLQPRGRGAARAHRLRLRHRLRRRTRARAGRRRRSATHRVLRRRQDPQRRSTPRWRRASCCFNVESEPELERIDAGRRGARHGARRCRCASIRTSMPQTHPYISTGLKNNKFGVAYADTPRAVSRAPRRSRT